MTLEQFISTYTGQAVDVDGVSADTGQCVQLVALYAQKVLGVTLPDVTGAVNFWGNSAVLALGFQQVSAGNEQPGDITVWGASTLIDSPEFGHTDIVVSPGFLGFDSNWGNVKAANGYPAAHEVQHTYTDVLGFLRYNGGNMSPTSNQVAAFYQAVAGRQPTAQELATAVSLKWGDWIGYMEPAIITLRDTVANLTNERDNTLYPFVNAVCADLNIPVTTNPATVATAITALQKAGTELNATNVEAYIQEHLS